MLLYSAIHDLLLGQALAYMIDFARLQIYLCHVRVWAFIIIMATRPLAIAEQKSPKSTRCLSSCSSTEMLDQYGGHAEKRRDHAIQAAGDMWAI